MGIEPGSDEIKRNANHLSRLLDIKTDTEYGEHLSTKNDAELSKKHAERFFEFVRSRLQA